MTLHCLHGFLGAPGDWDDFAEDLSARLPDFRAPGAIVTPDLFGAEAFPEADSIPAWGDAYCRRAVRAETDNFLLGYSLGGRLALHLAVQSPSLWAGIIIVGANPGLDSAEAREQRRQHDEIWAQRFESEPWEPLLAAWDAQPVFRGGATPRVRREEDFSRSRLVDALRRWSLGRQNPLWASLGDIRCPLLWVAGAADTAQAPICRRVQECLPGTEVWVADGAGHRVPWDRPEAFTARVAKFLTDCPIPGQI